MRHLPLRTEMMIHGKHDHAGRLLTDDQRHAPYPNHTYWQGKCDAVVDAICRLPDNERNAAKTFIDDQPDDITHMSLYFKLTAWLRAHPAPQPAQPEEARR